MPLASIRLTQEHLPHPVTASKATRNKLDKIIPLPLTSPLASRPKCILQMGLEPNPLLQVLLSGAMAEPPHLRQLPIPEAEAANMSSAAGTIS